MIQRCECERAVGYEEGGGEQWSKTYDESGVSAVGAGNFGKVDDLCPAFELVSTAIRLESPERAPDPKPGQSGVDLSSSNPFFRATKLVVEVSGARRIVACVVRRAEKAVSSLRSSARVRAGRSPFFHACSMIICSSGIVGI